MIDLAQAWDNHVAVVLADRDDPTELHASDLHSCDFALHQRVHGTPQLPFDDGSFANFERGHAYETRLHDAIVAYAVPLGLSVTHGREVTYRGVKGNLDWTLERDGKVLATIDLSTTASSTPDWKYGHALKSAFYAVATGADRFCEWVFCFGFGGKIVAQEAHWFNLDDTFRGVTWRERVHNAIDQAFALIDRESTAPEPPYDPVDDEYETWRCGKVSKKTGVGTSYCRARCPLNAAYIAAEIPA
jgi:hypothetical protein